MIRILPALLLCACLMANAQLPPYVPSNGLAAWYPFDGNANDASGNGHDGTVQNAVLCPNRYNQSSSAYYFGGSNQQIICTNDTSITNHTDLSVSVWFNVENRAGGWQQNVILANIGTYTASGGFEIFTSNPPNADITGMFRPATYADQPLQTVSLVNIDSAQWNHVVYILHYITAEDSTQASIYLNGNFIRSQKYFHSINYSGITPLIIGDNIDSICCQRSFKGRIDDIGLWNRELTQQEITDLFNAINTGTDELSPQHVNTYPNPASNEVTVNFSEVVKERAKLSLYDARGREVKNFDINTAPDKSEWKFSVADLPAGIYLVKITSGKKQWLEKIMKQ